MSDDTLTPLPQDIPATPATAAQPTMESSAPELALQPAEEPEKQEPVTPAPPPAERPQKPEPGPEEAPQPAKTDTAKTPVLVNADGYWDDVLTGDPATVPDAVRRQAACMDPSLDAQEQDYLLAQTINRSWLVDNRGLSRESVRAEWPVHRAKLAGELGVADDEMEVFCGLSIMRRDTARREAAKRISTNSYRDGLLGKDYQDDNETLDSLHPEDRAAADALGVRCWQEGADLREKWLPLAQKTARGLDMFAAMEEEYVPSQRLFTDIPEFLTVLDDLCELKEEDLDMVLYLASDLARGMRKSGTEDEGVLSRFVRALHRGGTNFGLDTAQAASNLANAATLNVGQLLGKDIGKGIEELSAEWDKRNRMAYRLRQISQQGISPLTPPSRKHKWDSYLVDTAEAIPTGILSFAGVPGFSLIMCEALGGSLAEARSRAPEGDLHNQLAAGMTAGAIQAGIYLGLNRVGGKMLENSISSFMKARGAGAAAFSMEALKTSGALTVQGAKLWAAGKASQATELGTYELFSRLEGTASNIDWKQFGENFTDIEANMHEAAMLLPFILIGSGRATLRHFRSPETLLRDPEFLKAEWGMDEPTIRKIMEAPDTDTKGELLRQAIVASERWNDPAFLQEATRAMALLNTEYFTDFSQPEVVRDFLRLPAEGAGTAKPAPRPLTTEEMQDMPEYGVKAMWSHVRNTAKTKESFDLWYSWLQKSHLAERVGPYFRSLIDPETHDTPRAERSAAYQLILGDTQGLVPERMLNSGAYAPLGEAERRALLQDTVQEATDLSYQFILWAFPPEYLCSPTRKLHQNEKDAEAARQQVLGQVGRTVLSIALGTKPEIAMKVMQDYFTDYLYRRKYRGSGPAWMAKMTAGNIKGMPNLVKEYEHYQLADKPELREMLRVFGGLSACAKRLVDLLPMSTDFTTALSRGMSPAQAFHHLTQRALGYDPAKVTNYPMEEIRKTASETDTAALAQEARHCYNLLGAFTGLRPEQAAGEGGTPHWRLLKPDGTFTRWHADENSAITELAVSMAPYFAPMGDGFYRWLRFSNPRKKFNLADRPTAGYEEFCGFDQLAGIAAQELKDYLFRSASRTLPGFIFRRMRRYVYGHATKDPVRVQTRGDTSRLPEGDVRVDSLTTLTPYTLINARLRTFWKRMLDSRFIPHTEVADFLQERGLLTAERREKLEKMLIPPRFPKRKDVPLNQTPPADIGGHNRLLAEAMADFQTTHYFAHLEDHKLPDSVYRWFCMVPFCPPLPPDQYSSPVARYVSRRIPAGPGGRTALAWNNRMTAMKLNDMAQEFADMRTNIREKPLPENIAELFRLADGESPAQRYEQGWCFHAGGLGVFRSTPQRMWNMLQFPVRSWDIMSEAEKDDLRRRVGYIAMTDPAPQTQDAAGRGADIDHVEQAVRNLDDVLQRHPELHQYAPVPGSEDKVRLLTLQDDLPKTDYLNAPEQEPISLDFNDLVTGNDISSQEIPLPDFFRTDPDALPALRFLHTLRGTTARRPYVADNRIWWNGTPYGGLNGQAPDGLQSWYREPPIDNIFRLLNHIQSEYQGEVEICGIPVRGAEWTQADFRNLDTVTVYRWPMDRTRVYRLMPGYPDSNSDDVRTPYMVLNHRGLYLSHDGHAIHDPEELYSSYMPLEFYKSKHFVVGKSEERMEWCRQTLERTLDDLLAWPEYGAEMVEDPVSGVHGLDELLFRLCEDTGFSHLLKPDKPLALAMEDVRIINIARSALECMLDPQSGQARQELADALRPLQDPKERKALVEALLSNQDRSQEKIQNVSEFIHHFRKAIKRQTETPQAYPETEAADLEAAEEEKE